MDAPPAVRILARGWEKGLGAMFQWELRDRILVFRYPGTAPRLFHTFFSPPLRIIALTAAGEIAADRIVPPNRFAPLPACRLVVEMDPACTITLEDLAAIAAAQED